MPDYENDIVFKPELTWEELCEWAKDKVKKIEGSVIYVQFGDGNEVVFKPYHSIEFYNEDMWCEVRRGVSYERMKNIIQALYEE
jgi:hypothetical protein